MRRRADPMESRSFPRLVAIEDTIAALLKSAQYCSVFRKWPGRVLPSASVMRLSLSEQYRTVRLELRSVG
jgi:hypothetical protein